MRHSTTEDLFTTNDKTLISDTVSSLLGDADVSASLVYERCVSASLNLTTQQKEYSWSRTSCNGCKGMYSLEEIGKGGGAIERDDLFIIIPQTFLSTLSDNEQNVDDCIMEKIYESGTVNVTNGSTTISRYSSSADWDRVHGTDVIRVNATGDYYEVKESAEATLTLISSYDGSTATNQTYELFRRYRVKRYEPDLLHIIWKFQCRSI